MASTDVVNSIMSSLNLINKPSAENVEEKVESLGSPFAAETVEKLFANGEMVDFYFTFDSGERVPAHKFLLSAGSEVFRSLFNGPWKEKSEEKLTSVAVATFKEFLQFFYLGNVKLTMDNIADVMRLCKMYDVAKCSTVCGQFLKSKLNDDNVCWAYGLAIDCDDKELKMFCEKIIGYNTTAVFASESFKTCSREVLSHLLDMDKTICCPEAEIFEACMTWVKRASKQDQLTIEIVRDKLGDLFYKIRFGSMPLKDISRILASYGTLFSTNEYKTIMEMCMPGESQSLLFCESRQKTSKAVTWNDKDLIRCDRYEYLVRNPPSTKSTYFVKEIETTTFSSDKPLMLAAVGHALIFQHGKRFTSGGEDIPTEVSIIEIDPSDSSESVVLPVEKAVLKYKGSLDITLSKLIFIKPNFLYKIRLEQSPPQKCCLDREYLKSKVNMMQTNIIFSGETIEHEDEFDKYSRGLITGLQFIASNGQPADNERLRGIYNQYY